MNCEKCTLYFCHLADALIQKQLGLSALLKGIQIFHLVGLGIQTNNLAITGPTLLTASTTFKHVNIHKAAGLVH